MDCIFCKIIKGEIPSNKIYENQNTYAFLDINPVNHGHTLVIPKKHYINIFDTPEETLKQLILTIKKITPAIKKAVNADGINIGLSNEQAAGQAVFHIHFHIMPRFKNDGLKLLPQKTYESPEQTKQIAQKIKNLL